MNSRVEAAPQPVPDPTQTSPAKMLLKKVLKTCTNSAKYRLDRPTSCSGESHHR